MLGDDPAVGAGGGHHVADGGPLAVRAVVQRDSESPSARRVPDGSSATGPVPREITAVGRKSAMCWNVQCSWAADCQLSRVTSDGTRPVIAAESHGDDR